jgi:hypothetical protein
MDFNTTLELIIKDLNDTCKIIDNFKSYQGVPELHVELAKAKCKSAAEIIALLKKSEQEQSETRQSQTTAKKPLPEDKFIEEDILIIEKTVVEEKEIDVKTIEPEKQPTEESIEKVEANTAAENAVKTQQKPSSIIADNFAGMSARINEQQSKHIDSLSSAIGLNDKFLLIREIFNGDNNKYEQTIAKLEVTASMADAKTIISEYADPDNDDEAMVLLIGLIKRKLSPDE